MKWDWYAATIRDDPELVRNVLADNLGGVVEEGFPRFGYEFGHLIKRNGDTVATVFSGGRNGHPNAFASSDDAVAFAEVVRGFWPDRHHVTRMDAAEDFDEGPGTWERIYSAGLELADERSIKISQAGDWHREIDGKTFYMGSTKSAVRTRIYEKGKELLGRELTGERPDISPDLVRLEAQVRPEGASRFTAASMSPEEAFGCSDWSKELLRRVMGLDVERVHIRERRQSDRERALEWVAHQYGEHFAARAAELGGWDKLGLDLERRRRRQNGGDDD